MPLSNLIIPQSFDITIEEENTYKVFGKFVDNNIQQGYFYTSTYGSADPFASTPYGIYLPDPDEDISYHYTFLREIVGGGVFGQTECATPDNDPDNNNMHPECFFDDEPITDIFDYRACCIRTIRWQTCTWQDYEEDGFNLVQVPIRKYNFDLEQYGECTAGMLRVQGVEVSGDSNPYMYGWELNAYDWPYDMTAISMNNDVSQLAGYSTDIAPAGALYNVGAVKEERITLLPNFTYRRDNYYCDHRESDHVNTDFQCEGDDVEGNDLVNLYGTYEITDDGDNTFLTLNEHPPRLQYDGTQLRTLSMTPSTPNEYGNPCVSISGEGTKFNGLGFLWNSNSCVSVGVDASDTGFDLSIPQGDGFGGDSRPTPYEGFMPSHGLKILKSYPTPEYANMLWYDRDISIYYLASDGRFMTLGGSLGVYELNRKDETLKLIGLTLGAKCRDENKNIQADYDNIYDCIENGFRWYEEGNTIIEIDNTGFQDGVITGTITSPFVSYYDNNCDLPPCPVVDALEIGEIKSLPAKFDSSIIGEGLWGSGENPTQIYIHNDTENAHMTWVRNRVSDDSVVSGADFGYDMVTTLVGEIGIDEPGDTWQRYIDEVITNGGTPTYGYADGFASWRVFYGYGFDYRYANGSWDPIAQPSESWKHREVKHRFKINNQISFDDDNNPSYVTIDYPNPQHADIDIQYYDPFAPCDCITNDPALCGDGEVWCGSGFYGSIPTSLDDQEISLSINLGAEACDADNSFYTCTGQEDVDPIQCLQDDMTYSNSLVINECIGCRDPQAENYCSQCTYSDFSCFYILATTGGSSINYCDVTLDGNVDILDIVTMVNIILGNMSITPQMLLNADVNQDGNLNILDVVQCCNMILGITPFPQNMSMPTSLSNSDKNLLSVVVNTIQQPGGLKNAARMFKSHGYTTRRLRDHLRRFSNNQQLGSRIVRQQNHVAKSKKVERNLTRAREDFNNLKNGRR